MKDRSGLNSLAIAAAVVVSLAAAGCNGAKGDPPQEQHIIRFWHIYTDTPTITYLETLADEYESEIPGISIEYTVVNNVEYKPKLQLQLAADDPPEIFHSWGGGDLANQAEAGYLRDITDWIESDEWPVRINAELLDIYSWNGRRYGYVHDSGMIGFWYNRDLLQQAGYDAFPGDWAALMVLMENLKAQGITPVSLGMADPWTVMYYWVYLAMRIGGGDIFSDILEGKRDFDDPAMVTAAAMTRDFYEAEYLQPTHIGDDFLSQSRYMGDGICAMQLMGQWAPSIQAQMSERGDELEPMMSFAPFPSVAGGQGGIGDAMGGGNGFVVGKGAPDEAIRYLMHFLEPKNLQRLFDVRTAVPTVPEVTVESPGMKEVRRYLQVADDFALYPDQLFSQDIGVLLNETSALVILGEITPEDACRQLQDAWTAKRQN